MNIFKLKMLTNSDKWLIIFLLIVAVTGVIMSRTLFADEGRKYVQISVNGEVVKTIVLRAGYREEIYIGDITLPQNNNITSNKERESNLARNAIKGYNVHGYNIIEINSTGVRVREAECSDLICVKTGWASAHPQQIVCLPNRVVVKIISDNNSSQVDDIAR